MEKLENVLRSVDTDEKTQTMVFHSDFIEDIYERAIVYSRNMTLTFNSPTNNFFDAKANGTLSFELHLPYNNKVYDETEPCVPREQLAFFFIVPN